MENGEKTTDIDDDGIFIMCDCYGHALHVARFEKEEEIYLSVFERGLYGGKLSWRERECAGCGRFYGGDHLSQMSSYLPVTSKKN